MRTHWRDALIVTGVLSLAGWSVLRASPAWAPPPQPPVVSTPVGKPPSDAIVLMDGVSLAGWVKAGTSDAAGWKPEGVAGGWTECQPGSGSIATRESFGDVQIHLEFATPDVIDGKDQGRGNSGVYIMGRYEVQVLDSYENPTYPDGSCGSVYGIAPPLVNASRPPGTWQTYDIIFRAPRFDAAGKKTESARVTVLHNGVLVQNNTEIPKATLAGLFGDEGASTGPIYLQDHGNRVRYRNIWVRRL